MRQWIKASATTAFLAAGMIALGSGSAHADITTSGNGSLLSGNQIVAEGNVPVNVSGNAIGVLGGFASAESVDSSARVEDGGHGDVTTSGDGGAGSGNQIVGDLDVPVNVCGNAVAGAVGFADATCVASEAVVGEGDDDGDYGYREAQSNDITTSGNGSLLSGNQAVAEGNIPVNVSGNSGAGLVGFATAESHDSSARVEDGGHGDVTTSGDGAAGSGNQAVLDADVPVNVTGNAVAIAGGVADAVATGSEAVVE